VIRSGEEGEDDEDDDVDVEVRIEAQVSLIHFFTSHDYGLEVSNLCSGAMTERGSRWISVLSGHNGYQHVEVDWTRKCPATATSQFSARLLLE
jgi:hypothetical protein